MDGQLDLFGNVEMTYKSREDQFREECEKFIVADGTGFLNGKHRVMEHYRYGTLTEEILKKEYGNGGHSVKWKDGTSGFTNHDAKGIKCTKNADGEHREMEIIFFWKEVLKIIKGAIYEGEYTTEKVKW